MKLRITKEFTFDMAHALPNYNGKCSNIHGHTYKLLVTIIGEPHNGMVLDFKALKIAVTEPIVDKFDHAFVVSQNTGYEQLAQFQDEDKFITLPFDPTCENLTIYFAEQIAKLLPQTVQLFSVRLYETATSFAEWFASDNE